MKTYIEQTGKTAFGFCDKTLSPFYIKTGFQIIPHGVTRFKHATPTRFPNDDTLYLSGKDQLIEKMLENPDEVAELSRPHW